VNHPFNQVDSAFFLKGANGYCIYFGNDCFLDKKQLPQLRLDVLRVDVAMLGYAFIHYYPHLLENLTLEKELSESQRLNKQCIDQALAFMDTMNPRLTVPIGASLFYDDGWAHPLNTWVESPWEMTGRGHYCVPMFAGDFVLTDCLFEKSTMTPDSYRQMLKTSLGPRHRPPVRPVFPKDLDLSPIQGRVSKAPKINHMIQVNNVFVDCQELTASLCPDLQKNHTRFLVDEKEFLQWVAGTLTFEEVIGTRRFTYSRQPDEYNLEAIEWWSKWL
jgi:hypothetical protein